MNAESTKLIASHSQAKADFFFEEMVEAGIVLKGTEVKSLRMQSPTLKESFVEVRSNPQGGLEAWLLHLHIPPYVHGNIWNHDPMRNRKLLLHRHQIAKIFGAIKQKGLSAVPMRLYFKNGMVKVEIGLGKGKTKGDKRQTIKKRAADREMAREMSEKRGGGRRRSRHED